MEDINKDIVQRVYLSRRIKEIRKQLGLSMSEFGEKLDTSKNSVSQWESAKVIPNAERLRKIAELGKVPIEFLYLSDLDVVDLNVELSSKYTELMMPASYFNDYTSCKVYKFDAELSFLIISGKHSLKASCYIYDDSLGFCSIVIEETSRDIPHQFRYFIDYQFEDKKANMI
ncbi:MAG: helix-turn-helix domain-containing protein [Veillonella parvula]